MLFNALWVQELRTIDIRIDPYVLIFLFDLFIPNNSSFLASLAQSGEHFPLN